MGADQSKGLRSLTMRAPTEQPMVIDVSDEVLQRVKEGIQKQAREHAEACSDTSGGTEPNNADKCSECPRCVTPAAPKVASENRSGCVTRSEHTGYGKPVPAATASYEKRPQSSKCVNPASSSPPFPAPNALYVLSPSTLELKRQIDLEVEKNDAVWRQRISQFEQSLTKTEKKMEEELVATIEKVKNRLAGDKPFNEPPPCHKDRKEELLACYRDHRGDPLKCSEQVANFRDCVDTYHAKVFDGKAGGDASSAEED